MIIIRDPQTVSGFVYENPLPGLPLLTHCGEAVTTRTHAMPSHRHAGFEFMYLVRGDYAWMVDDQVVHQSMGDLFIAFPGQFHQTAAFKCSQTRQLWAGVLLEDLGDEGKQLSHQLVTSRCHLLAGFNEFEPLMRGIIHQVISTRMGREGVVSGWLTTLLRLIAQRMDCADNDTALMGQYSYPVLKAIQFMTSQLDRRLSLAEVAAFAGLGRSQLCERFSREVGHSPAGFHLRGRLVAARQALTAVEASVTDVAIAHGFSSSQHFSSKFRSEFGITPLAWRTAALAANQPS